VPDDDLTTTTSEPASDLPEENTFRTDLLAFANGAVVISTLGLTGNADASALSIIDGSNDPQLLTEDASPLVVVVLALPAPTVFDRFVIPGAVASPDEALFQSVTIEGSMEGPDGPWVRLANAELASGAQTIEMLPTTGTPISWIRLSLEGGDAPEESSFVFGEIVGNGTQEAIPFDERFTGTWEVRQFDRLDTSGRPLTLTQSGTVVSGCLGEFVVTGTVDGAVARALATDPESGRSRALLLVPDDNGELIVALTNDTDSIQAARGVVSAVGTSCNAPPPEPPSCGDTVHILFDADSAEIRRDSERVLDDLFVGLGSATASSITIIGHTSTEGEAAYNQGLSERRAAAVVNELIERGFDALIISSEGRGETEPLVVPDVDEASRSLNRRVEVSCTS